MTLSRCPAMPSRRSEQGKQEVGQFLRPNRPKRPGQSLVPLSPPYGRSSVWDSSSDVRDAGR
jgi:hypothetical protein